MQLYFYVIMISLSHWPCTTVYCLTAASIVIIVPMNDVKAYFIVASYERTTTRPIYFARMTY